MRRKVEDTLQRGQEQESTGDILIVEDDDAIGAFLIEAIAQETSYSFTLATHSKQALYIAQAIKPRLFILNYHLPQMNGIELYDHLHQIKELEHVPAIMVSAALPEEEVRQRKIIGIKKPFDLIKLLDAIDQLVG